MRSDLEPSVWMNGKKEINTSNGLEDEIAKNLIAVGVW